jgi:hypothetical protein
MSDAEFRLGIGRARRGAGTSQLGPEQAGGGGRSWALGPKRKRAGRISWAHLQDDATVGC